MPNKSIPTLGDSNWGTPLNNHLSQLQNPTNGGINSFEQFSQRPTTLTIDDIGKTYLYTQTGNIHQWNGSSWKVLNESVINVKDYGAIGDGVVDDTAAIQLSFNSSGNLTTNFTKSIDIFFPSGIYTISTPININNQNGYKPITIRGVGDGSTGINAKNCDIFKITGTAVTVRDLSFATSGNYTYTAIDLTDCGYHIYENLFFGEGWENCFRVSGLLNSKFDKITVVGPTGTLPKGNVFSVNYSVNNSVSNCFFSNYNIIFYFSLVQGPNGNYSEGWNLSNVISVICDYFVFAEKILLLSVIGCTLDFNSKSAILIKSGGAIKISNNWIAGQGEGYAGIVFPDIMNLINISNMSGAFDSTITGNTFYIDSRIYKNSLAIKLNNPTNPPYTNSSNPLLNLPTVDPVVFVTNNNFDCANAGSVIGKSVIIGNSYTGKSIYDLGNSSTNIKSNLEISSHYDPSLSIEKRNIDDTTKQLWKLENYNINDSLLITDKTAGKVKLIVGKNQSPVCFPNGGIIIGTQRSTNSVFTVDGLTEFTNNAMAIAGGLTAGDTYRTGEFLKVVF